MSINKKDINSDSPHIKLTLYFRKDNPMHMRILKKLRCAAPKRKMTDYIVGIVARQIEDDNEPLRISQYKRLKTEFITEMNNAIDTAMTKIAKSEFGTNLMLGNSISENETDLSDAQMDALDMFGQSSYEDDNGDEEEGSD